MDLLSVIRRWRFRDEMPLREIERRTGLSRNTIRKYLRADTVVPQFKVPDRSSKLDPFAEKLTGWLQIEAGKSRKRKAHGKADARRSGRIGLRWVLQSHRCLCAGVEG